MDTVTPEALGLLYLVALAATAFICVNARAIGERLKVMAYPDSVRKRHAAATPQLGGVAILAALAIWLCGVLLLGNGSDRSALASLLFCALGVGLIGFTDDQHDTSPLSRILFLCTFLGIAAVINPALVTTDLHWASFEQSHIANWLYCGLCGMAVIGLVNAVNMADGQDGIVGGMFAVWSVCLTLVTSGPEQGLAGMMLAATLVFLAFNLSGRLFMGDCGAYGVTFLFAMLAIAAHAKGQVPIETVVVWFFIPVMDCLRLLISRPLRGHSPFSADRDHFHHRLEDKLGKRFGFVTYAGAVGTSSLMATLEPKFALLCVAVLSAFYFSFAWLTDERGFEAARHDYEDVSNSNVVSMSVEAKMNLPGKP